MSVDFSRRFRNRRALKKKSILIVSAAEDHPIFLFVALPTAESATRRSIAAGIASAAPSYETLNDHVVAGRGGEVAR